MNTHFEFDSDTEAESKLNEINSAQDFNVKTRGKTRHFDTAKINTSKPYCTIIEMEGRYYIIADSFTSQFITDRQPVELPQKEVEI